LELDANSKEYIDIDDALKRIGGNAELYKKLLARFIDGNYLDSLCEAIQNGDMDESSRLAHTLKGVSANLSLVKIKTVSTELEQTIKDGTDQSGKLTELKQVYGVTLEKIAQIMK